MEDEKNAPTACDGTVGAPAADEGCPYMGAPAGGDAYVELAHGLLSESRRLRISLGAAARRWDGRGRLDALHVLHHAEGELTAGELARRCRVSTARMAQTLNQLEGEGLVERTQSASDRRRTIVRITDAGEAKLQTYFTGVNRFFARLLGKLGPEDSRELVRIIGRLADVARDATDEGGDAK